MARRKFIAHEGPGLIEHLKKYEDKPLDEAIRIAQKLLDRIVFIAFCEDRGLLPDKCLERAYMALPVFIGNNGSGKPDPRLAKYLAQQEGECE